MKAWFFSESAYPDAWDADPVSLRITLPSSHIDRDKAADILNRHLDEWALCDELGMNIMLNEHHSTATCLTSSCTLPLAILARETKKARLLVLGIPIANRSDPVRVAEEMSWIDLVSRGRVEMGFVKGIPYEIAAANSQPVRMMDRFWEAHDLILKAMSTRDGPFNWEGRYFHYRQVNTWPRPYQEPHPKVWITSGSPATGVDVARRQHRVATVLSALNARSLFHAYRMETARMGLPDPGPDRFGYLALVGVGDTQEEGETFLKKVKGYLETTTIVAEPFTNPPGYASLAANAAALKKGHKGGVGAHFQVTMKNGRQISQKTASVAELVDAGVCFAGTPDQVVQQIKEFNDFVGGCGNLLVMLQGGVLDHKDTVKNMRLFSQEVLPRVQNLVAVETREMAEIDAIRREAAKGTLAAAK
jgi:alkanesulfonate monooxygenase SsuD/methylene tetrahydromethanopterin reductase-like flavin-dependent oxidoreductase (luciferase family)